MQRWLLASARGSGRVLTSGIGAHKIWWGPEARTRGRSAPRQSAPPVWTWSLFLSPWANGTPKSCMKQRPPRPDPALLPGTQTLLCHSSVYSGVNPQAQRIPGEPLRLCLGISHKSTAAGMSIKPCAYFLLTWAVPCLLVNRQVADSALAGNTKAEKRLQETSGFGISAQLGHQKRSPGTRMTARKPPNPHHKQVGVRQRSDAIDPCSSRKFSRSSSS